MAHYLAQLEYWYPVPPQNRDTTPVFVDNANEAIKSDWWSRTFNKMLRTLMSAEEAAKYSTHSFRIMLACGAWAAGMDAATIQALCRWRSVDSLRTYVRWDPEHYSVLVDRALSKDVNASHTQYLLVLDPAPLMAALQQFPGA